MIAINIALGLCLGLSSKVLAQSSFKPLSDEEYKFYLESYPAYAAAEERLNQAWKKLKGAAPRASQEAYLRDQRAWVKKGRHFRASQLHGPVVSRVEAFTMATHERSEYLEKALERELGFQTIRPERIAKPAIRSPFFGQWSRTNVPSDHQATIEIYRVTADYFVFSFRGFRRENSGGLDESAYFESPNQAVFREQSSDGQIHEVRFSIVNGQLFVSGDPPFGTFGIGVTMEGQYTSGQPRLLEDEAQDRAPSPEVPPMFKALRNLKKFGSIDDD
ncbi:MAG: DUF1311 domain-containing protein [Deltaproteobacteria bacterium]|nr:DUF1311 domain-containing protein [Deltaproteobacteria bacterium]